MELLYNYCSSRGKFTASWKVNLQNLLSWAASCPPILGNFVLPPNVFKVKNSHLIFFQNQKQYNCQADQWSRMFLNFSKIISFGLWLPAVQPCNWAGFRISLSREGAIFRDEIENFFLLSPGETRSRLSYDHSRISRRERDYILLFSCFKTRSRL